MGLNKKDYFILGGMGTLLLAGAGVMYSLLTPSNRDSSATAVAANNASGVVSNNTGLDDMVDTHIIPDTPTQNNYPANNAADNNAGNAADNAPSNPPANDNTAPQNEPHAADPEPAYPDPRGDLANLVFSDTDMARAGALERHFDTENAVGLYKVHNQQLHGLIPQGTHSGGLKLKEGIQTQSYSIEAFFNLQWNTDDMSDAFGLEGLPENRNILSYWVGVSFGEQTNEDGSRTFYTAEIKPHFSKGRTDEQLAQGGHNREPDQVRIREHTIDAEGNATYRNLYSGETSSDNLEFQPWAQLNVNVNGGDIEMLVDNMRVASASTGNQDLTGKAGVYFADQWSGATLDRFRVTEGAYQNEGEDF